MPYIPHTPKERQEMLETIGKKSLCQLFETLPVDLRLRKELNLDRGLSEKEALDFIKQLAAKNKNLDAYNSFLGGGVYPHFVPAALKAILQQGGFYTSYTPYQAEASQGTLQAIYEYQSYICLLTGMDVTSASLYDGASAVAESILMARRINKRKKVLLGRSLHPEYRQVVKTYTAGIEIDIEELKWDKEGKILLPELEMNLNDDVSAVVVALPNFFGLVEDIKMITTLAHKHNALVIVVANPLFLSLVQPLSYYEVDIVCGEGQILGQRAYWGGETFGFIATRQEFLRKIPGRIVGCTTDKKGGEGFVLTLQAREQHIRREKATSNICSNQSLNALACSVYLSLLGEQGIKALAERIFSRAHYLYEQLVSKKLVQEVFGSHFWGEFVVKIPHLEQVGKEMKRHRILAGVKLGKLYPQLENCLLVFVDGDKSKKDLDSFVQTLGKLI